MKHNFKKKYGQNFLKDNSIIKKIVSSIEINSEDLIIEIGPGAGILSKELIKKCKVLAYEIDTELKPILEKEIQDDNFNIVWKDFLQSDLIEDIVPYSYKNIHVVANIPYYITTPIITKIIDSKIKFKNILVMVQEEVADRFCSKPGSKDYSSITVYLNYYFNIKKLFKVSKNCFYPKPNVDSAIILLSPKKDISFVKNEELFFKLIRDSFQFKRKTIKNNLKEYDLEKVETILKKHNFDLKTRAEQMPLEVFIDISNNL